MSKRHQGFTFIELLVTVTVLLAVTGGGIAAYLRFNQRQTVLNAAYNLQSLLKSAQVKAQVREVPATCNDPLQPLQSYRVVGASNTPGATISLYARCGVDKYTVADVSPARSTLTLPATVYLADDLSMEFYTLHGGVNGSATIAVSDDDASLKYTFAVTDGGEITEGAFE